ncbi:uncharacterized protein LOC143022195 [Oratosquilla oratoria]|uniref:uncharacterized protein LOC143022195 n=1 Tax=Oratosquilla oratoria TaxID=337810 RepID=UPI003F76A66B
MAHSCILRQYVIFKASLWEFPQSCNLGLGGANDEYKRESVNRRLRGVEVSREQGEDTEVRNSKKLLEDELAYIKNILNKLKYPTNAAHLPDCSRVKILLGELQKKMRKTVEDAHMVTRENNDRYGFTCFSKAASVLYSCTSLTPFSAVKNKSPQMRFYPALRKSIRVSGESLHNYTCLVTRVTSKPNCTQAKRYKVTRKLTRREECFRFWENTNRGERGKAQLPQSLHKEKEECLSPYRETRCERRATHKDVRVSEATKPTTSAFGCRATKDRVLLGGGRRHWLPEGEFDAEERNQQGRRKDGRNLIDVWIQDKKSRDLQAEYVWSKAQFDNVDPRYTDYLLGLFGYSHLDFEEDRNKSPSGDPSISEMTLKALQILRKNPHGFFLMVEGGRIDHAHHHNNARRALEEIAALEEAVMAALSATSPAETLIVLTADHSHVFTFGGYNTPRGNPITGFDKDVSDLDQKPYTTLLYGNGPGYSHSTPTGRQDISGYNSKGINFVQQSAVPRKYETHGGEDVPVYATGPSSYLFSGTVEQTYVAHAIAYASCMGDDSVHCEKPPSDDACARGHTEGDHYGSALYPQPQAPLGVSSSDVKDTKRPKSQWTTWHSGATLTSSVAKGGWQFLLRLLLPLLLLRLFCP